ncbi:MAG TPA: GDCCVxC domain-containing (seleno)protein [Vicinamibacterales bacterium]
MAELEVTITCPQCGHQAHERMPTDRCVYFFDCRGCGALLKPKARDCCVYCSYGDKRCPFVQDDSPCPDGR